MFNFNAALSFSSLSSSLFATDVWHNSLSILYAFDEKVEGDGRQWERRHEIENCIKELANFYKKYHELRMKA